MKRLAVVALCLLLQSTAAGQVLADGGTVQLTQQVGKVRMTVMTDPAPLHVGTIDVSVMLQDADSGEILPDGKLIVLLRHPDDPPLMIQAEATQAAATNKLLRSARVEVPRAGRWEWEFTYRSPGTSSRVQGKISVAAKPQRWQAAMPWIAAPVVPIGLYILGELLAARRRLNITCHKRI